MTRLRIGTRGSALALAQSRWAAGEIARITGETPEIVIVKTSGDRFQAQTLASFGGAGAFAMEIDAEQRAGAFEISVHSLKDLPTKGREGLILAAVPARAPVEDCLVSRDNKKLAELPKDAVIATGSARRRAQLLRLRRDLTTTEIRGNVETRIKKIREGMADATLLARAGLQRLGLSHEWAEILDPQSMIPAAGQGALAIVVREDAADAMAAARRLDDASARAETDAERAVLEALGGGCHLPLGVLGRVAGGKLTLIARVTSADGRESINDHQTADVADAAKLGRTVGGHLLDAGAKDLLPKS